MELVPREKVLQIPTKATGFADVHKGDDLIDVMSVFHFDVSRATNKSYFRGVSGYSFDAQIKFGFNKDYMICDIEFRKPFTLPQDAKLFFEGANLFQTSLLDVKNILDGNGVLLENTDVGLTSAELGVSFFSSEFEGDVSAIIDAVTVHL
jgi:hypothetical protein